MQAHAWVIGLERVKKRAASPSAEQSAAKRARGASGSVVPKAGRPRSRERTIYNLVRADLAGGPQTTAVATSLRDDAHTVRVVSDRKHSMATNCAYAAHRAVQWLIDTPDWSDPLQGKDLRSTTRHCNALADGTMQCIVAAGQKGTKGGRARPVLKSQGRVRRETRTQREQLVASFQEVAVSDRPHPLTPVMLRVIASFCIRQHGIVIQDCFAAKALETPHADWVVQLDTAMGYIHGVLPGPHIGAKEAAVKAVRFCVCGIRTPRCSAASSRTFFLAIAAAHYIKFLPFVACNRLL